MHSFLESNIQSLNITGNFQFQVPQHVMYMLLQIVCCVGRKHYLKSSQRLMDCHFNSTLLRRMIISDPTNNDT